MDTSITYITLTVYDSSLSSSILCPLLVSVPALSVVKYCISSRLTVNTLYHLFVVATELYQQCSISQQCSQVHCDWILYLELVSGYSPNT